MKKFVVLLLVLLVVSSSVFALEGISNLFSGSSSGTTQSATSQSKSSTTESGKTSSVVSTVLNDLDNTKNLKGSALEEHKENLQQLAEDFTALEEYRNSIHPFVNGGARFGLDGSAIIVSAIANFGLKFSSGLTTELGIGCKLCRIQNGFQLDRNFKNIGNWDASVTIGWQF